MVPERRELLYTGKAKRVWATSDPALVIMEFMDNATAFNGVKKATFEDKGRINRAISTHLFALLGDRGVATHQVAVLNDTEILCRKVEIVPVEVVVRNVVAGSFARRYGLPEGQDLGGPLLELFYKSDKLDDPLVNDDVAVRLGWATAGELVIMKAQALVVNEVLREFWGGMGLDLIDFKIEFGRADGGILLADEISPDGSRLWERGTQRRFDKDVFRRDLGDLTETYRALFARIFPEGPVA